MDATKEVLETSGNRRVGCETCREFARMGHRILPGCRDHCKHEFINW